MTGPRLLSRASTLADGFKRSVGDDVHLGMANPWRTLWVLTIGTIVVRIDMLVVPVANQSIMQDLGASLNTAVWFTSAFLLAFAVPLLVAGRLGDRFGPKRLYMIGLAVFTVASLWCGLSGSAGMLIAGRAIQGFGAALLTPQTMTVITRIFPTKSRGVAMGVWSAIGGVSVLVGPLVGGLLVVEVGWKWIFLVNVPIGIAALVGAQRIVPELKAFPHRFDIPGVLLVGVAMLLLVFGIEQGDNYHWSPRIVAAIVAGVLLFGAFIWHQSRTHVEPLMPLSLFRDRNFSLSTVGLWAIGFTTPAVMLPLMFYAEAIAGLTPVQAALLLAPDAILGGILAAFAGRMTYQSHPRTIIGFGFGLFLVALVALSLLMKPGTAIWELLIPMGAIGIAHACLWAPLGITVTRNLAPSESGAGAGVFNTARQIGAVLGSAAIGLLMTARLDAHGVPDSHREARLLGHLPSAIKGGFSVSLAESMLLPAGIMVIGVVAALLLVRPHDADQFAA